MLKTRYSVVYFKRRNSKAPLSFCFRISLYDCFQLCILHTQRFIFLPTKLLDYHPSKTIPSPKKRKFKNPVTASILHKELHKYFTAVHKAVLRRGCEHCKYFGSLHVSTITHTQPDWWVQYRICLLNTVLITSHVSLILWITEGILVLIFQVVWNDDTLAQIWMLRGQDWKIWMI